MAKKKFLTTKELAANVKKLQKEKGINQNGKKLFEKVLKRAAETRL